MMLPWTKELVFSPGATIMIGSDVEIAQRLLVRDAAVPAGLVCNGQYTQASSDAVRSFQTAHSLESTGVLDAATAQLLLTLHSGDGVRDTGFSAGEKGYKYKLHIPVHSNRSIETKATLFDADNKVLLAFTVRAHGHRNNDEGQQPWPDFGDGDVGLNQFSSNGATTTGLIEVDLNSAEPNADLYGPWPVNRLVRGLEGNAQFLLPSIRDGQLLHTGNWSTAAGEWNPTMDMPNSSGCLHAHPDDVYRVYEILTTQLGVEVRPNPFTGKDYPYKPQGILVIEAV